MSNDFLPPSMKWEVERDLEKLGSETPLLSRSSSSNLREIETALEEEEAAQRKGRADGLAKKPMDPYYTKMVQTDKQHEIGYKYAEGYKEGRESAYRKTGSNRRRKMKKSARKTRRVKKLNGRK